MNPVIIFGIIAFTEIIILKAILVNNKRSNLSQKPIIKHKSV